MTPGLELSYEEAVDRLDASDVNGSHDSADFLPAPDKDDLNKRLLERSMRERALLNHIVHWQGEGLRRLEEHSDRFPESIKNLISSGLIIPLAEENYVVPLEVKFTENGPGRRWDQLSGFWHRLPSSAREEIEEVFEEHTEDKPFPQCISNRELQGDDESLLGRYFGDRNWTYADDLDPYPISIEELPERISDGNDPLFRMLARGLVFPFWDEEGMIEAYVINNRFRDSMEERVIGSELESDQPSDHEWEREPFGPVEQVKALMVVADAVPFRSTQDAYPHLFDLKEAEDITGWDRSYIHTLFHVLREEELLDSDEERFYLTERVEEWLSSAGSQFLYSSLSRLPHRVDPDNCHYQWNIDFSLGILLEEILTILVDAEGGMKLGSVIQELSKNPIFMGFTMSRLESGESIEEDIREFAETTINFLYKLGLIDLFSESEQPTLIRINDRGNEFLEGETSDRSGGEDLPVILQPDGTLMLPLNAPLDYFLRVNPFVLITGIDQMVEYKIDRQGLVQALNKGWDATGIRDFLDDHASGIPEPIRDLFDSVLEDVEEVHIESVHHLLEFDSESATVRALDALSNYDPLRVEDMKVLLRKKTTEETIRRNLARGGIRLQSARNRGLQSPTIELN